MYPLNNYLSENILIKKSPLTPITLEGIKKQNRKKIMKPKSIFHYQYNSTKKIPQLLASQGIKDKSTKRTN
jgi:hypothetical protein